MKREAGKGPSPARCRVARPGRPRWLQAITTPDGVWDAFEASAGAPLVDLVRGGRRLPWARLRHWLHDLASELWSADADGSLPEGLALEHVWISAQGRAVLLDAPWPGSGAPAEVLPVGELPGQQRFLSEVSAHVEGTSLPRHARPVLRNLGSGTFEKLSFLAGTLQGLLDRPAAVSRGVRAGALFLMPFYVWTMLVVGAHRGAEWLPATIGSSLLSFLVATTLAVLAGDALVQLVLIPFRASSGHSLFRMAVVDAAGELATRRRLLGRWAVSWLPLLLPLAGAFLAVGAADAGFWVAAAAWSGVWLGAVLGGVLWEPHRGLHDRLAGTWVVRL